MAAWAEELGAWGLVLEQVCSACRAVCWVLVGWATVPGAQVELRGRALAVGWEGLVRWAVAVLGS